MHGPRVGGPGDATHLALVLSSGRLSTCWVPDGRACGWGAKRRWSVQVPQQSGACGLRGDTAHPARPVAASGTWTIGQVHPCPGGSRGPEHQALCPPWWTQLPAGQAHPWEQWPQPSGCQPQAPEPLYDAASWQIGECTSPSFCHPVVNPLGLGGCPATASLPVSQQTGLAAQQGCQVPQHYPLLFPDCASGCSDTGDPNTEL